MKKLFLLTAMLGALCFTACSDDNGDPDPGNTTPIENLQLPTSSADNPLEAGSSITINGKGFTASDEIWFRRVVARAAGDVKAENVTVSATGISFTAPTMNGKVTIIMVRSAKEYSLGDIYLTTDPVSSEAAGLYAFVFALESDYPNAKSGSVNGTSFVKIDSEKGTYSTVWDVKGEWDVDGDGAIYSPATKKIYTQAVNYDDIEALCSFELSTGTSTVLAENWFCGTDDGMDDESPAPSSARSGSVGTGISIGIIDGKLHGIKIAGNKKFSLVEIADNGTETPVKTVDYNRTISDYTFAELTFEYDKTNKIIYFATLVDSGTGDGEEDPIMLCAWDLTANKIIADREIPDGSYWEGSDGNGGGGSCSWRLAGSDLYFFDVAYKGQSVYETSIQLLDSKTLQGNSVKSLNYGFDCYAYLSSQAIFVGEHYIDGEDKTVIYSFNPSTKQDNKILEYEFPIEFSDYFVVE